MYPAEIRVINAIAMEVTLLPNMPIPGQYSEFSLFIASAGEPAIRGSSVKGNGKLSKGFESSEGLMEFGRVGWAPTSS
jgi:hypothetical protein